MNGHSGDRRVAALLCHMMGAGSCPEAVVRGAEACEILPAVVHYLGHLPAYSGVARQRRFEQGARIGLYGATLRRVVGSMPCRVMVLKGPMLGMALYGSAMARASNDVDIWVASHEVSRACDALEGMGYASGGAPRVWATNQHLFWHETLLPVEVHWAMAPPPWRGPTFDEAWQASEICLYEGGGYHVLSPSHRWVHLLMHAHQHLFAVKPWLDLAAALSSDPRDTEMARHYGVCRADALVRDTMEAVLGRKAGMGGRLVCSHLSGILSAEGRGELVFGQGDGWQAASGVLARALSMGLLDGWCRRLEAGARVLLFGPHRVGAWMNARIRFGTKAQL